MKPLSRVNKLILLVLLIIIGITVWVVWLMFSGVQKPTNTNTTVSQNQNSNTANINVANTNTQPTNLNASVDTSNWKTYRNEELNLVFSYPEVFGEVLSTRKTKLNDPAVRSGESIYFSFDKNPYITILAATSDYEEFKGFYYTGGEDLALKCSAERVISNASICQQKIVAGQKTYEHIRLIQDEGAATMIREIHLNLLNPKYKGIIIHQGWSEIAQIFENYATTPNELLVKDYLGRLMENKNLTVKTVRENAVFEEFIKTTSL